MNSNQTTNIKKIVIESEVMIGEEITLKTFALSINDDATQECDGCTTSIFYTDNAVYNILAPMYATKVVNVGEDSPLIGLNAFNYNVGLGDIITPAMIVAYWQSIKDDPTKANIIVKCANCQPCDIDNYAVT